MEDFSNFPFCHALIRILQVIFLFLVAFEKEAPSLLSELEKVLLKSLTNDVVNVGLLFLFFGGFAVCAAKAEVEKT